ncbi:MAG: hypothetical protein GEU26_15640 [Nitrososphaeraceae archaeon]|nr:hypothetical protein [Nitrososphaeraceae archaeon]
MHQRSIQSEDITINIYLLETQTGMEHGPSGLRSEDEYFQILRNRILECICEKVLRDKNLQWFHSVDLMKECAKGFLDELGVDQYQFIGEYPFYQQVHDKILRPLVDADLMIENGNNNFTIKPDSKLHDICKKQLKGKAYISWDHFCRTSRPTLSKADHNVLASSR